MREEPTNPGDLLRPPRRALCELVLCITRDSGDGADVLYVCARRLRDTSTSSSIHGYKPFFNMKLISRVKR